MIEKKYFRGIRLFCRILHILDLSWLALHSTFKLIALFPTLSVSFRLLQEKQNSLEKEREISSVLFLRPFNRLDWIPLTTSSVILFTQPVHSEGDQPWDFFGKNDAKAETPILWPPHVKSWLIGKDSDAGRDWGQEEKGTIEDEMAGWHHHLDGRESEWIPGVGDGQGGLACCDSWVCKESDTTERLNWLTVWGKT